MAAAAESEAVVAAEPEAGPITEEHLVARLTEALEAAEVTASDLSDGCGAKFSVVVVSEQFAGKPLLKRHRMVHAALAAEMETIHALTMKTYTPEQWAAMTSNADG